VTTNIDLVEDDRDAILCRELGDSLVSVLLQHVEDDESLEFDITERIRNAVTEAASTTGETSLVSLKLNFKRQ
jgi:hypothetical protein